jgi:peptide/nickel transport system ATP-binding protein
MMATPDSDMVLDIRGLRVRFPDENGGVVAVDRLDLSIRRGEIVALVGESGSGKSMTALAVMGLLPAGAQVTTGSITLHGTDLLRLPQSRLNRIRGRQVAMLFQQPKSMLDPTATVGSQVAEPLRQHLGYGRRRSRERVVELLRDVGIPEPRQRAGAYAHQLSGGLAQRAMIAAALAGEPDVLVADEPTTALDVTVQAQILQLLKRKQRESGMAVLLITHDLGIVSAVADRVAVMYAGRIVENASTRDIFADPRHPYTRALLRASLLRSEHGRLYAIPGNATQSRHLDHGCRFLGRCTVAVELGITTECEHTEPQLHTCASGHESRCWASERVAS